MKYFLVILWGIFSIQKVIEENKIDEFGNIKKHSIEYKFTKVGSRFKTVDITTYAFGGWSAKYDYCAVKSIAENIDFADYKIIAKDYEIYISTMNFSTLKDIKKNKEILTPLDCLRVDRIFSYP